MKPEEVGLTAQEYHEIVRKLGRAPNDLELGLFGALWSEHCSYKSSKSALSLLPNAGPAVVAGPGGNAGVVRLEGEWLVAFKVESHNHPSYVEPVQGAATGVGGIIRDVVAMGARPIALMDSLRFGEDAPSQRLLDGVVEGVGNYGNSIGVPTVGGEVYFAPAYAQNPLVNVMCVGLLPQAHLMSASGARVGSGVYLLGQPTGRDGIHGASLLASQDFTAEAEAVESMRPTVQVGDPFTGKLLMEATLAAIATGGVEAAQDLGAAGLTSASAELAYRSGVGMELDLDGVPLRESAMTPYEIMLSETQERMLLVVPDGQLSAVRAAVEHWDLTLHRIGRVIAPDVLRVRWRGQVVAEVPPSVLSGGCPIRPLDRTAGEAAARSAPLPVVSPELDESLILRVLAHPDCRDRAYIYRRYDWMIQTRTVFGPEHDVAVLHLRETAAGLTLAISGPGRWAAADAWAGGAGAVARAVLGVMLQDSEPLGMTDGINCGNPDRPAVYGQFRRLVEGIAEAARAFGVPVTGGNVSFHNETEGRAIWPTGIVGVVGRHPHPTRPWRDRVGVSGWRLVLLNPAPRPDLGGSVLAHALGQLGRYPAPSLTALAAVYPRIQATLRELSPQGFAVRAILDGGLLLALAKLTLLFHDVGVRVQLSDDDPVARLFSEEVGQVVVALAPDQFSRFAEQAEEAGLSWLELGETVEDPVMELAAGARRWRLRRDQLRQAWQTYVHG
jgi:phosphoribosylformylglycinamidine synthase II